MSQRGWGKPHVCRKWESVSAFMTLTAFLSISFWQNHQQRLWSWWSLDICFHRWIEKGVNSCLTHHWNVLYASVERSDGLFCTQYKLILKLCSLIDYGLCSTYDRQSGFFDQKLVLVHLVSILGNVVPSHQCTRSYTMVYTLTPVNEWQWVKENGSKLEWRFRFHSSHAPERVRSDYYNNAISSFQYYYVGSTRISLKYQS